MARKKDPKVLQRKIGEAKEELKRLTGEMKELIKQRDTASRVSLAADKKVNKLGKKAGEIEVSIEEMKESLAALG